MSARADILAGRAVILVNIQDAIDKQLRGIRGKMRVFANSMSEIGGDLFRGGIAGSVASFFPVKSFVDFQDSILFMQAKLKDTGVDVEDLTTYIRELGKTTSFTSKEIAEGAAVLAQAGLGMKVKGTLLPMLDLARSARVDVDTAGRIMANTMMAFEVPADMAGEVASKLTTAARLGTTDLVLMAESLKYLQTTARGLNIPLDETLALVTHLSNIGMRGSIAGTSLNAALGNLAAKPGQLKEKLGLVIEPEDVEEPLRLFTKLLAATKDMDALTKKATMSSLFNIRGERAFGGIMLQSLESLDDIIKKIKGSTDEAREAAVLMDSRLGGVWRRGLSAAQEFGLAVGSTSEGPLSKFGVAAQKVFQDLSNLAQANPQLVQTILLIPPAALAAGAGLLLMSTMLSKVIMLIGPLITLNAALFKSLAAIVGVNLKAAGGIFTVLQKGAIGLRGTTGPSIPLGAMIANGFTSARPAISRAATSAATMFSTTFAKVAQSQFIANIKWMFSPLLSIASVLNTVGRGITSALLLSGGMVTTRTFMDIAKAVMVITSNLPKIGTTLRTIGTGATLLAGQFATTARNAKLIGQMHIGDAFRGMRSGLGGMTLEKTFTSPIANAVTAGVAKGLIAFNKVARSSPTMKGINQLGNVLFGKQIGRKLNVSIGAQIASAFKNLSMGAPAKAIATFFSSMGRGFAAIGKGIVNTNWLAKFISGFKMLGTVLSGIFSVLNGIRRVLFSLSGWLLIAEVLILFGDKIPIVKDALAGLGRAFSNVFGNISDTLKDMGPGFNAITGGISKMFSGGIESGIADIGAGFRSMGKALSEGVVHTWRQFVADIEPGAMMIRNAIKGIIGIFDALVASIGSVFGTVIQGGGILIKADGSLLELFKSIFSPENFQSFFTMIITLIGEIGKGINTALGYIFTALDAIKRTFVSIIQGFNKTVGMRGTFDEALGELDENAKLRANLRANIDFIESMSASDIKSKAQGDHLRNLHQRFQKELDALGYTRPMDNLTSQRNANLEKMIQEALQRVLSMSDPMGIAPSESNQQRLRRLAEEEFGAFGPENLEAYILNPFDSFGTAVDETTNDLLETRKRLLTDLGGVAAMDAIRKELVAAPNIQAAEGAIGQIAPAVKALIGDFESTRGGRGQFKSESLQEKANKRLEAIETNTALAAKNRPATFHA